MKMTECYFQHIGKCGEQANLTLTNAGIKRIQSIIIACKQRGDTLPTYLESCIRDDRTYTLQCHKSCVSSYTSKKKKKVLGITTAIFEWTSSTEKIQTICMWFYIQLSDALFILWRKMCRRTGVENPSEWGPGSRCRSVDSGPSNKTFKEKILQVCKEHNDQWAKDVELRLLGAVSHLHAADARYHQDCRPKCMGPKSACQS